MGTDKQITGKFVDYRNLIELCKCGHREGSHKYGMCYGNWMSCKCKEFQRTIPQNEVNRILEILNGDSWVETK